MEGNYTCHWRGRDSLASLEGTEDRGQGGGRVYSIYTVGVQKKFPFTVRTTGTGNPVPFPFNFRPVAVQSRFVFNPFYGQPIRSINQVNGLGSARN